MGRYYPPSTTDAPTFNTAETRKKPQNQTVRFELPFAVWCTTCKPHTIIGQGVRFNAEKKRVGSYLSTPVWAFRFKHTACSGWIEIRTDPKNTEYVVHEGGQRRDYGPDDKHGEGVSKFGGEILTEEERERRRNDAFAALEGKVADKKTATTEVKRVQTLLKAQDRDWNDPYTASQRLRRTFRADRKVRARKEREAEGIKDRLGLGIELLEEAPEDAQRAALVEFGNFGQDEKDATKSLNKPLFRQDLTRGYDSDSTASALSKSRTKASIVAEKARTKLQEELKDNTRSVNDPFLLGNAGNTLVGGRLKLGIKRKLPVDEHESMPAHDDEIAEAPTINQGSGSLATSSVLVDYDSD